MEYDKGYCVCVSEVLVQGAEDDLEIISAFRADKGGLEFGIYS